MILDSDTICGITSGTAYTKYKNGVITFHRFTEEQEEFYRLKKPDLYHKVFATAGVKMRFSTDGAAVKIKFNAEQASSRKFFALEFFVNGKAADVFRNFPLGAEKADYVKADYPLGEFEKTAYLGDGEKETEIYFPWSVALKIREVEICGATFVRAVKPEKTLFAFGDSITQGYDALYPHNRYCVRLAETLGACEVNKAIGAEIFTPALARIKDGTAPDYISVAYGTNDWCKTDFSVFKANAEGFIAAISENYPESKLYVLTPVWRKDYAERRGGWDFSALEETLAGISLKYGATLIHGFGLLPHNAAIFSDGYLHPNDKGFGYYSAALTREIKK